MDSAAAFAKGLASAVQTYDERFKAFDIGLAQVGKLVELRDSQVERLLENATEALSNGLMAFQLQLGEQKGKVELLCLPIGQDHVVAVAPQVPLVGSSRRSETAAMDACATLASHASLQKASVSLGLRPSVKECIKVKVEGTTTSLMLQVAQDPCRGQPDSPSELEEALAELAVPAPTTACDARELDIANVRLLNVA